MTHTSPRPYCAPAGTRPRVTRVAREPMVTRNYRVPQRDWDAAMRTADEAGESWADALREFTAWYAHRPRAREPWRPERSAPETGATGTGA